MNIKKIIREEIDDFDWFETEDLNHLNWKENAEKYGGPEILVRDVYNNDPMSFLLSLPKMEQVQSKERENWTLFRYKAKHTLMFYDKKNEEVFIDYYEIWSVLEGGFGLNYSETQQVIKEWLSEVYNLRGVTTPLEISMSHSLLSEVYNLRGVTTQWIIWVD